MSVCVCACVCLCVDPTLLFVCWPSSEQQAAEHSSDPRADDLMTKPVSHYYIEANSSQFPLQLSDTIGNNKCKKKRIKEQNPRMLFQGFTAKKLNGR